MGKRLTAAQVKEQMQEKSVHPDVVSVKNGIYTARWGYFFSSRRSSEQFAEFVKRCGFEVIDHGDHWTPFRGGASVSQQSHFWVKFKVEA